MSGASGREPGQDYLDINLELKKYDDQNQDKDGFEPLSKRRQIVVLNKVDSLPSDRLDQLKRQFKKETGVEPYLISAVTGAGVKELIRDVSRLILKEDVDNE